MGRPRVILADDYEPAQRMCRELLEPDFDIVAAVGDGEAAVQAVKAHHPDLLVLDVSMPLRDGFSAARQLKEEMPHVKILFLSMHAEPAYLREAARIGVDGYVIKRNALIELRVGLRRLMEGNRYYPQEQSARSSNAATSR
ncbi:MAG: response regulator transcription factor [Acidobacteriaceae bacterium]|nr:response regulator transcription factor [Acidobacteriaceae bacterium]MBV9779152.1 response regulator transcription factor [Acidobacteriaceae bacterium]